MENLALRGKATQSTLYGTGFALNAIDGNRDGDYFHGSCTHTKAPSNPWWTVDLRRSQSTLYGTGFALNAIDGNRDGDYFHGSCTHTKAPCNLWWRVDLRGMYRVMSVTVTNRQDCCSERINGAEISIGNSLKNNGNSNPMCAKISSIPAGDTITFQCKEMEGRYVNIFLPGREKYLTLCEVEVHGIAAKSPQEEQSLSLVESVVMRRGKLYFSVRMPSQWQHKRFKKRN
ncbi:fucolectin-like [Anguilla anguilla]|uniref:fucolectin-like n=1 Tax=Anguilla anguilla TaxID=7936 RepID=UPI0015AAE1C9|nr:fucolectin-like [Anguilla anguilla]